MFSRYRVDPLYVTRPIRPDAEVFSDLTRGIFERGTYTNFGPLERDLTKQLTERFGVGRMLLMNNGTSSLMAALLALEKTGGTVITTPFTFAATVHSILLAGLKVKFADIDRNTLNLSAESVRSLITPDVVAVLPVHVYGNPCDFQSFKEISEEFGVAIIYDAAHCFDVYENGSSVYIEGDISVGSLHATKLMHTGEGGLLCSNKGDYFDRSTRAINFGIQGEETISGLGFNGKMNEVSAAMGLAILPLVSGEIVARKMIGEKYIELLRNLVGVLTPVFRESVSKNYMYFPVIITENAGFTRDAWWTALRQRGIFARKYFYPLISDFPPHDRLGSIELVNAAWAAQRVLCLPIHSGVTDADIEEIVDVAIKLSGI